MKLIYTSFLGYPKSENNKLVIEKLSNSNGYIDSLKSLLVKNNKLLFITNRWENITPKAQPKDEVFNDYHYSNKEFANALKECYSLSGISFNELVVVDCDYVGNLKEDIESSDLIFIQGGHTPRGLKILKDLNFNEYIKNYNGVILLTGTASKLPASKVLSTHHGNKKEYEVEEGLCLKKYSIRPHFDYNLKMLLNKKFRARISLIKDFSKYIDVYALGGNSYMIDDNGNIKIYGECHCFKNGKMKRICKDNSSIIVR